MLLVELEPDDLHIRKFPNKADEVYVYISMVASAIARANNPNYTIDDEREQLKNINAAVQAEKLKPKHPLENNLLPTDDYGNGIVLIDELVNWGHKQGYNFTEKQPAPPAMVQPAPAAKGEAAMAITTHTLRTKDMPLDAEIATAKSRALDKANVQSVWDELVKMASKQEGCLIGESDLNGLKYGSILDPQTFTKDQLRDRMRGRKNRANPR